MSDCAFDQSGDGPNAENLLANALAKAYDDGKQSVYNRIEELLARKAAERKAADEKRSKESQEQFLVFLVLRQFVLL